MVGPHHLLGSSLQIGRKLIFASCWRTSAISLIASEIYICLVEGSKPKVFILTVLHSMC